MSEKLIVKSEKFMEIFDEIVAEKAKQDNKFPGQWKRLKMVQAYPILAEEVGEVAKEINDVITLKNKVGYGDMRKELVQVATVAIRMIEMVDRDNSGISSIV